MNVRRNEEAKLRDNAFFYLVLLYFEEVRFSLLLVCWCLYSEYQPLMEGVSEASGVK